MCCFNDVLLWIYRRQWCVVMDLRTTLMTSCYGFTDSIDMLLCTYGQLQWCVLMDLRTASVVWFWTWTDSMMCGYGLTDSINDVWLWTYGQPQWCGFGHGLIQWCVVMDLRTASVVWFWTWTDSMMCGYGHMDSLNYVWLWTYGQPQ